MIISGLQKTSFIDYPDKIAAVVFTRGCDFRCAYCHNPELVDPGQFYPEKPMSEIMDFFRRRQGVLEGVVITGGEPTLYPDLPEFIKALKKLGYLIKLDTNGTNFPMLEMLVKKQQVDYVAMDIKQALEKYSRITPVTPKLLAQVKQSLEFLLTKPVAYEFRTTILPKFFIKEDFTRIGKLIKGAEYYYLQQFRPQLTLDPALKDAHSFSEEDLESFKKLLQRYVAHCEIRGII